MIKSHQAIWACWILIFAAKCAKAQTLDHNFGPDDSALISVEEPVMELEIEAIVQTLEEMNDEMQFLLDESLKNSTSTPSVTPSSTPSMTPSSTPSVTPSVFPSETSSRTPSSTPSVTPSVFPSETSSRTPSLTPSVTPSVSPTLTWSPSRTPSATPSAWEESNVLLTKLPTTNKPTASGTKVVFPLQPSPTPSSFTSKPTASATKVVFPNKPTSTPSSLSTKVVLPVILNTPSTAPSSFTSKPTASVTKVIFPNKPTSTPSSLSTKVVLPVILNTPSTAPSSLSTKLNNFISAPKAAATTVRFQGISKEMSDIDEEVFEAVVEYFVEETKLNATPTITTVQSVLVTKQKNGPNHLDISFTISGDMTYSMDLSDSVSYEEIVLNGFTTDFSKFVRYLRDASAFFKGIEYVTSSEPFTGAAATSNTKSNGSSMDNSTNRDFGEGGFTGKEILIIVGGLSGFLVLAAFTYKIAQRRADSRYSSEKSPEKGPSIDCVTDNHINTEDNITHDWTSSMDIYERSEMGEMDIIGKKGEVGELSKINKKDEMDENNEMIEIARPKSFEVDLEIQKKFSEVSELSQWTIENACHKTAASCNITSLFDFETPVTENKTFETPVISNKTTTNIRVEDNDLENFVREDILSEDDDQSEYQSSAYGNDDVTHASEKIS